MSKEIEDLNLNKIEDIRNFNFMNQDIQNKISNNQQLTKEDKKNIIIFLQDSQEFQNWRIQEKRQQQKIGA